MPTSALRRRTGRGFVAGGAVVALALVAPLTAQAASPYPSDSAKPDLVPLLAGYDALWTSDGPRPGVTPAVSTLRGTVLDPEVLSRNDELAQWINDGATSEQQFRALQDAQYNNAAGTGYDQSFTVSQGLGTRLSALYVDGLITDRIPLTEALINSSTGSTGAYVGTGAAKLAYGYPRPYITGSATTQNYPTSTSGGTVDPATTCPPADVNATSLAAIRDGKDYATDGQLDITSVAPAVDTTHEFSPNDVSMNADYASTGICTGGSFPSGHTTTAYQAGITLATLLPELAPEILARASEAGNDRIVLGVHYPLDIVGGRIGGEVALATRWSDAQFRTEVIEPARQELIAYLLTACGTATILDCAAQGEPYLDDPYGGQAMPGGTDQVVFDRSSALAVYQERLTYGFPQSGTTGLPASVPDGASNLLLTAFPTLTDAQRTSVLAQTEVASGYPLDLTASGGPAWQRLDLAAAMSATVQLNADGSATVTSVGGAATVLGAPVAPGAGGATPGGVRLPVVSG